MNKRGRGEEFTDKLGFRWVECKHAEESLGIVTFECENSEYCEATFYRNGMLELNEEASPEAMAWILSRILVWATEENLTHEPPEPDDEED